MDNVRYVVNNTYVYFFTNQDDAAILAEKKTKMWDVKHRPILVKDYGWLIIDDNKRLFDHHGNLWPDMTAEDFIEGPEDSLLVPSSCVR